MIKGILLKGTKVFGEWMARLWLWCIVCSLFSPRLPVVTSAAFRLSAKSRPPNEAQLLRQVRLQRLLFATTTKQKDMHAVLTVPHARVATLMPSIDNYFQSSALSSTAGH